MTTMHSAQLLVVLLPYAIAAPNLSPVHIRIDTNLSKSENVDPHDRTRFDLVEQFHPLQTASVVKGEYLQELKHRVEGVKSVQGEVSESFTTDTYKNESSESTKDLLATRRLAFGEWSVWSSWAPCMGGERSRVRSCSSKISALRIVCHGEAKEVFRSQVRKCFSTQDQQVPVAEDPWTIEREISGDFKA